jgi:hypothetical protein
MIQQNIGSYVKSFTGNAGLVNSGAVQNGSAIDRLGELSCVVYAKAGTVSGTPTSWLATVTLQQSVGATTPAMAHYATVGVISSTTPYLEGNHDFSGAQRYVRVVIGTPSFTGGTSPSVVLDSTVILGGSNRYPF